MSDELLGKDYPERNQEKNEGKNDGSAQEAVVAKSFMQQPLHSPPMHFLSCQLLIMKYDTRPNSKDLVYDPRHFMSLNFPVMINHSWAKH